MEIERKFLITNPLFNYDTYPFHTIEQGIERNKGETVFNGVLFARTNQIAWNGQKNCSKSISRM